MICFVHHRELVPADLQNPALFSYDSDQAADRNCLQTQAGFRWIHERGIGIFRSDDIILKSSIKRGEFGTFLNKWGASYNCFAKVPDGKFDDIICLASDEYISGFSLRWNRGRIVYLPFQPNTDHRQDFSDSLFCLIDSLLTYKTKCSVELPEWAKAPLFKDEIKFNDERSRLQAELKKINNDLLPFEEAKSLLVSSERVLEDSVPRFIASKLGIKTFKDEKFVEDFWILGEDGKSAAICEIKSTTKGFKKGAIYDVYNHREKHDLDEDFPAILFTNFNLQAGSWKQKLAPIQEEECKIATELNVLIIRIEDLVQIWDSCLTKKLNSTQVFKHLISEHGWLECKDGELIIHK